MTQDPAAELRPTSEELDEQIACAVAREVKRDELDEDRDRPTRGAHHRPRPPAVFGAIRAVMRQVQGIDKHGTMSEGKQHYKFRQFEDLATALGAAFRDHGVAVQSRDLRLTHSETQVAKSSNNGTTYMQLWSSARVEVTYVFTSLEDGSTFEFATAGEGRDLSDKATAKAMTMALKTALTQALMLGTDERDPDASRPSVTGDTNPQRAPVAGAGADQIRQAQWYLERARTEGVTFAQVNRLIATSGERGLHNVKIENNTLKHWLVTIGATCADAEVPDSAGYDVPEQF